MGGLKIKGKRLVVASGWLLKRIRGRSQRVLYCSFPRPVTAP